MDQDANGPVSRDHILGAAIGDAMGGPVECQHAVRAAGA